MKLVRNAMNAKESQMLTQLKALSSPISETLPDGRARRFKEGTRGSVTYVNGHARFSSPKSLTVSLPNGSVQELYAKNFLIATGSRPRELPQFPVDGKRLITSDHVAYLGEWPKSLLIVGAGVIGCEYATIFSSFGQTAVHLLNERRPRLLPGEDEDLSAFIGANFERSGVNVHHNSKLLSVKNLGEEVEVVIGIKAPGSPSDAPFLPQPPLRVSHVLFAVGRVPNTNDMGCDKAGLALDDSKGVKVGLDAASVSASHIYAAGDSTADIGLVSVAEMEGRHAIESMYCTDATACPTPLSYENVSSIMFLRPEVACVGMTEQEARAKRIPHRVAVVGFDLINRAIINRPQYADDCKMLQQGTGFVKIISSDDGDLRLLGMRAVGEDSSALLQSVSLLIGQRNGVQHLERVLQPHPSLSEAVQEAVRMLQGRSIYKPHVFSSSLFRCWSPSGTDLEHGNCDWSKTQVSVPTYMDNHDSDCAHSTSNKK